MIRRGSGRKPQFPSNELSYVISTWPLARIPWARARPDCALAAFLKNPTSLEYLKVRSRVSFSSFKFHLRVDLSLFFLRFLS